mgnify:CR=1 FL=1
MNSVRALLMISIVSSCYFADGQTISNAAFSHGIDTTGKAKYFISYDLSSGAPNVANFVRIKFSFSDGRTFYLKEVSGDVGPGVMAGKNKRVEWRYTDELISFSGEVKLNIEAIPSVQVPLKTKKRRDLKVTVAPFYEKNKTYALKLFRNQKEITRLNDMLLIESKFSVNMPKNLKTKKGYQLLVTDGEHYYYSNPFKIKGRMGAGWVIWPIIAGGLYYAYTIYEEDYAPLPGPPGTPSN